MADVQKRRFVGTLFDSFEWVSTYDEFPGVRYEHQLVWLHGTHDVMYGTRVDPSPTGGDPRWTNVSVRSPERLGFDGTRKGFDRLVEEFTKKEETS